MGKDSIRFGILGCGNVARRRVLPALKQCPEVKVTAVANRTQQTADDVAREYSCDAAAGYTELLERDDIDAVYIALPVGLHRDWCIAAANAGKHIVCEKSLARSSEETREIIAACRERNVALLEGFAYQYHPNHGAVREVVESGSIGEPVEFRAAFGFPPIKSAHRYSAELGGGALLDAGTYTLHAARTFFGCQPESVYGKLAQKASDGDYEVDIHGSAFLDFGGRQSASVSFGFDNMYQNYYSIWCTKGVVRLDRPFSSPAHFSAELTVETQGQKIVKQLPPADHFAIQFSHFCSHIHDQSMRDSWMRDCEEQAEVIAMLRGCGGN